MTRVEALELYNMSISDLDKADAYTDINARFRHLAKHSHPDTCLHETEITLDILKTARDVLLKFAYELHNSTSTVGDGNICQKCFGRGFIKVVKGFEVKEELCDCMPIVKNK